MKFRLVTNEEFTSLANRDAHYDKHVVKGKQFKCGPEEYEARAELLQTSKVDNRKIFGYQSLTREGRTANCKYNRDTEEFVVYTVRDGKPYTVTFYKKDWREFTGDKAIEYYDELVE